MTIDVAWVVRKIAVAMLPTETWSRVDSGEPEGAEGCIRYHVRIDTPISRTDREFALDMFYQERRFDGHMVTVCYSTI